MSFGEFYFRTSDNEDKGQVPYKRTLAFAFLSIRRWHENLQIAATAVNMPALLLLTVCSTVRSSAIRGQSAPAVLAWVSRAVDNRVDAERGERSLIFTTQLAQSPVYIARSINNVSEWICSAEGRIVSRDRRELRKKYEVLRGIQEEGAGTNYRIV